MKRIIFHHPRPLGENMASGSRVRPVKMLEAFEALGYRVELVDGYSKERATKFEHIKANLQRGVKYDFCYAENAPSPYALTDPDHFPRRPTLDRKFFRLMKDSSIPTGLFYRDIYWRFPVFKREHSLPVRLLSYPFYYHDLSYIGEGDLKALFLPSQAMKAHFPTSFKPPPVTPLPPGAQMNLAKRAQHPFRKHAVYVGGLLPPLYSIRPMFDLMQELPDWKLTIICRENERVMTENLYPWASCNNVKAVHAAGESTQKILAESDVFLCVRESDPYLDFAMPVKIFEAMGNALPILTNRNDSVGQLISDEGIGWVEPDITQCIKRLQKLDEADWRNSVNRVMQIRENHTWQKRAETVVQVLSTTS